MNEEIYFENAKAHAQLLARDLYLLCNVVELRRQRLDGLKKRHFGKSTELLQQLIETLAEVDMAIAKDMKGM